MIDLATRRLRLRPYMMDDLDFYASLWADADVVRFIGEGVTRGRSEAVERLLRIIDGYATEFGLLAMWHQAEQRLVGQAGLTLQEVDGHREIEVGYWLARDAWGHGFATEAAQTLCEHAFRTLELKKVISLIQPENIASIAVAKRAGMRFDHSTEFRGREVSVFVAYNPNNDS